MQSHNKIAFCVSGQIRGSSDHLVAIRNEATRLGADVFMSVWASRGQKTLSGHTGYWQLARLFGPKVAALIPANFYDYMERWLPDVEAALASEQTPVAHELHKYLPSAVIDIQEPTLALDFPTLNNDVNSLRMLYLR